MIGGVQSLVMYFTLIRDSFSYDSHFYLPQFLSFPVQKYFLKTQRQLLSHFLIAFITLINTEF